MDDVKGTLEATVLLKKSACYYMKTGRCSLDIVSDLSMAPSIKSAPDDLLYCPRILHALKTRGRDRTVKVVSCRCGHAEVVAGHQRACVANRTGLQVTVEVDGDKCLDLCQVCGRQMTFDEEEAIKNGGARIVGLKAVVPAGGKKTK